MLQLSTRAQLLLEQTRVEPQIILEIEGIDLLFGATPVTTILRYDTPDVIYDDPRGFIYDGVAEDPRSRDYINIKGQTTKSIQQQIKIDYGTSSISSFTVELINKDRELSDLFVPGNVIQDLLGSGANIYTTFQGSAHPQDSVKLFQGLVSDFSYGPGNIKVTVTAPDDLKRQEIFTVLETELSAPITSVQTNIPVVTTDPFFLSQDIVESYIRVDDELMEVTAKTDTTFTVVRGARNTSAVSHDDEAGVSSLYVCTARPIDMALKILISNSSEYFYNIEVVKNINTVNGQFIQNAIEFNREDIESDLGVVAGDEITLTGSGVPSNNTVRNILSVVKSEITSYIVVDGVNLSTEGAVATCSFHSQYNTLADGCEILPQFIDIERFKQIDETFSTSFPEQRFYFKETIEVQDFVEQQILNKVALYSIPRKGRISVGYSTPPLSVANTPRVTYENITNISKIAVTRSIKQDFYNAIVHRYNEALLEDKFTAGEITVSGDALTRIPKIKNRPLTLDANGLSRSPETITIINRIQSRLINRYQFGAYKINKVDVLYKTGFPIEIGDVVAFGDSTTAIIDPETGEFFNQKLFEVINKTTDIINGKISIDLLDTSYSSGARFGTVAPSSIVATGSTTTLIVLENSYNTQNLETDKWLQYFGQEIVVHNDDFSVENVTRIIGVSPSVTNALIVEPALPSSPTAGQYISCADFDTTDTENNAFTKNSNTFISHSIEIDSGASNTVFDVFDASLLSEGMIVKIVSDDLVRNSDEIAISDITGLTITMASDLGFTPQAGDYVELINFEDESLPYRIV